jgi:hypothetical protein
MELPDLQITEESHVVDVDVPVRSFEEMPLRESF